MSPKTREEQEIARFQRDVSAIIAQETTRHAHEPHARMKGFVVRLQRSSTGLAQLASENPPAE